MKKTSKIIAILLIVTFIFASDISIAYSREDGILIDNLYYRILNEEEKTVEVIGVHNSEFLSRVDIPERVEINGENYTVTAIHGGDGAYYGAFYRCDTLKTITIPDSVKEIGEFAFFGCSALTSITIPEGVTSIRRCTFDGCTSLTKVIIPNSVKDIDVWAFYECNLLTDIVIPESVINIGESAFYNCKSLKNITIPSSVRTIGTQAFCKCESLESVVILDGVTSIGESAFNNCTALKNVVLPNTITCIEKNVFCFCSSLSNIVIPNSVISINTKAFYDCSSLKSINIPNSVESISGDAFGSCSSLTSLNIPSNVKGFHVFEFLDSLVNITISNSAEFHGCYELTNVIITESNDVNFLHGLSFGSCYNLKNVVIPKNIQGIPVNAFDECKDVVLNVYEGSYAEQFAKENEIKYKIISENNEQIDVETGLITIGENESVLIGARIDKDNAIHREISRILDQKGFTTYQIYAFNKVGSISKEIEIPVEIKTEDGEIHIINVLSNGNCEKFKQTVEDNKVKVKITEPSICILASKQTCNLNIGEELEFQTSNDNYHKNAKWVIKDPSIAENTGTEILEYDTYYKYFVYRTNIKAIKKGITEIELVENGNVLSSLNLKITDNIRSIEFENTNQEGIEGSTIKAQEVKYNPTDTTDDKTVKWSLSNNDVASIDEKGNITCKKAGQTEVIAKVGEFTCKYTLNIKKNYIIGDVNQDQKVDSQDAVQVLKHVAHNITLNSTQLKAADTNKDGKVDSQDAVQILKYVAHNISEF